MHSLAKIWIESNGEPCVEVAESSLSNKDTQLVVEDITNHYEVINSQITKSFNGEKTIIKNIGD